MAVKVTLSCFIKALSNWVNAGSVQSHNPTLPPQQASEPHPTTAFTWHECHADSSWIWKGYPVDIRKTGSITYELGVSALWEALADKYQSVTERLSYNAET